MTSQPGPSSAAATDPVVHARNRSLVLDALSSTGIIDKLRAQIRASVAHEVLARSGPNARKETDGGDRERALESIVFNYLVSRGLELSASVFLAESGLNSESVVLGEKTVVAVLGLGELQGQGTMLERVTRSLALSAVLRGTGSSSGAVPSTSSGAQQPTAQRDRTRTASSSTTQRDASNLGFSRPSNIVVQLLETAGVDFSASRGTRSEREQHADRARSLSRDVPRESTRTQQATQTSHPPSISASTSLPPLPPNRHTDSTQTHSHPHRHHNENHHHNDQLAARLTAAESEKEAWRREVRRLRREVDSLRRAVLEDEAVKEVGARARETLRGRESVQSSSHSHSHSHSQSYRDKERPEIPSFGLHNAPQIDVTAIFDSIDTYDSRPPRTRGSTLERDIRTDTPDSKTLDSLLRGDGDASLEIDPEVVLLMDEVRRREFGR